MFLSPLDPRLWGALILALALSFAAGFWKGNTHGTKTVRAEWLAATATANQEARALENARQRRADEAAKLASAREAGIRASADRARRESLGLRDDLSAARDYAAQSRAAADEAVRVTTGLLEQCASLYLGVAEAAARADSEARELRQGWPR